MDVSAEAEAIGNILNGSSLQTDDSGHTSTGGISGNWPNYIVHWDRIAVHKSVRVQFTLAWAGYLDTPEGSFVVCATADSQQGTLPPGGTPHRVCDTTTIVSQSF